MAMPVPTQAIDVVDVDGVGESESGESLLLGKWPDLTISHFLKLSKGLVIMAITPVVMQYSQSIVSGPVNPRGLHNCSVGPSSTTLVKL